MTVIALDSEDVGIFGVKLKLLRRESNTVGGNQCLGIHKVLKY